MPVYYLDTSASMKLCHVELGAECVDRLFADMDASLITANFTLTELTSALDRKLQERVLTPEGLKQVLSVAVRDVLEDVWLIDFKPDHVRHSQRLILRHHLRTLDALHLAWCSL